VSNPSSKQPLLTLLKQARAFGVGIVLATQNPVDLDYKGLSNTGTWFIGRLQTERDKGRVMEGLEGAAATTGSNFDRQKMDQILAGLGNRVFLMNNTHEDAPIVFQTRWSLSYLRGPLTRDQIKQLMDPYKSAQPAVTAAPQPATPAVATAVVSPTPAAAMPTAAATTADLQPTLSADVPQYFIPLRGNSAGMTYQPMLLGAAKVHFADTKSNIDTAQDAISLVPILDQAVPVDWETAKEADISLKDLEKTPVTGAKFGNLPAAASKARNYTDWGRDFAVWLYGDQKLELLRSPSTGQYSQAGEAERDFRIRLQQAAREQRDKAVDALRLKYSSKINLLQEKVRKANQAVEREAAQSSQAKVQTALAVGATLLSAFTGRKLASATNISKATTAMRGVSRSVQQQSDVGRAKDTEEAYQKELDDLNAQFKAESDALASKIDPAIEVFETVTVRPKKTDIYVQLMALAWTPYRQDDKSNMNPAW
jgi:hypothetical protein